VDCRADRGGLTTRLKQAFRSDGMEALDRFRKAGWKGKSAFILATWFGTGLIPVAPGTFGTLAAIPLVLIGWLGTGWSISVLTVTILVALWSSHRSQELLEMEDPSEVVIDEAAGIVVTLFLLPPSWMIVVLGFFLFRLFDILKPWPIRPMERLHGGLGIVADDLMAGMCAHLVMRIVLWLAA